MRRSLFIFLLSVLILFSISMQGSQNNPAVKVEGVDFIKKSLSEILNIAKKQNKLVMLDAFSFN